MILVVGATGLLGRRICRILVDQGAQVRALVRDGSAGADELRTLGVEPVIGDLRDAASLDVACRTTTAVVTTANAIIGRRSGDTIARVDRDGHRNLIQAAQSSGVNHFTYVSVSPVVPANNLFVRTKRAIEAAVRESGMAWTIVQPTAFMDVHLGAPLGWNYTKGGARIMGSPDVIRSYIAADDVAQFAARACHARSADGRALHIAGPDPLTAGDAVRIAQEITGRSFKVQRIPAAALRAMSILLRPLAAGASSLTAMAAADVPDVVDMAPLVREFGIALTPYENFVRSQLAKSC